MRVLAIMCHPDDMELCCSGTLIKYKKLGHEVIVCHAANGNMGHVLIMPDELKEIRRNEVQKAAALAGFEVISADIGDLTINSANEEQLKKIIRVIRYARPDVIITHYPEDYCSDHNELSKLVFKASFDASCPHFMPELGKATDVTPIYYADTDMGMKFVPTEYVDITEEMNLKEEMLACHKSQVVWLKDHDGIDAIEMQRILAAERGGQCGVKYAEAFLPLIASQRMRTYRVLP
ncbi:MAG: PIG-L family deacetylase [Lachnospiraceae bacterium]|nr:PIG-L family deacetylase [Lachnospiraceae bacterium]